MYVGERAVNPLQRQMRLYAPKRRNRHTSVNRYFPSRTSASAPIRPMHIHRGRGTRRGAVTDQWP